MPLLVTGDPFDTVAHQREDFFYRYCDGRYVAFADAGVTFIPHGVGSTVWSAMLGKDDNANWDDNDIDVPPATVGQLKVGNWVRLGLLVVLALLPLPWVWLNPTSAIATASIAENEKQV